MGSIPLPALDVHAQQQGTSPLEQYAQLLQIKNAQANQQFQQQERPLQLQQLQQQTQAQSQQLQDQTAARQLFQQAYANQGQQPQGAQQGAPAGQAQPGAPPQAGAPAQQPNGRVTMPSDGEILAKAGPVLGPQLVNNLLDISKKQKDLETAEASIQEKNDAHQQSVRDTMGNFGYQVQQHGYDPNWATQALDTLSSLNPSFQQVLAPIRNQIMQGGQPLLKQLADNLIQQSPKAQKEAGDIAAQQAELPGKQAQAQKTVAEQQALNFYLAKNRDKTEADYEVSQAGRKAGAEAGARLGSEETLEKFKTNLQRGMLPQELQAVAPQLVPAAAGQYIKASTDYNTALNAQQEMDEFIKLAKSGNKVAYAYSPTTGVLTINSANGVKRVNMAEIGSYSGAGSAFDRLSGWFGKQVSGQSIPDDILNDMQQVHDHLGETAQQKYSNQVQATNATYGSKFKAQNFGQQGSAPPQSGGFQVGQTVTLKGGKTVKVKAVHPDGSFDAE